MATVGRANRRRIWAWFWLAMAAVYLLVPLISTAQFSLEVGRHEYGVHWYATVLHDHNFWSSFLLSLRLAIETAALGLILMVPTVYWVHTRLPRLRPVMEFIAILPFVIPPIALAVGFVGLFQGVPWVISSTQLLAFAYVILALPFTYRSLDAGLLSIDIRTLTDAAHSVGASWWQTLWHVILPNIRTAVLAATLLTVAVVLGEYTISSLLLFNTFAVYIQHIGVTQAYASAALAVLSFFITWLSMLGLFLLTRRSVARRPVAMAH